MPNLQSRPAPRKPFDAARYISHEPGRLVVDGFKWEPEPRAVSGHRLDPYRDELVQLRQAGWTLLALITVLETKSISIDSSELSKFLIRHGVRKIAERAKPANRRVVASTLTTDQVFDAADAAPPKTPPDRLGRDPQQFATEFLHHESRYVGDPEYLDRFVEGQGVPRAYDGLELSKIRLYTALRFIEHPDVVALKLDSKTAGEVLLAVTNLPAPTPPNQFVHDVVRRLLEANPTVHSRAGLNRL
jgi:hypothetical protein